MKISLSWITEILGQSFSKSSQELADRCVQLGFEVASFQEFKAPRGLVTAEVLSVNPHPNADRLRIANVTDGLETREVVCGAPNLALGQKVFWAKIGAELPNGMKLKETAIRGVVSPGMLCAKDECGLGAEHAGLWLLPPETPLGVPIEEYAPLSDTIFDIELTPNRGDCLSQIGILRELSLAEGIALPKRWIEPPAAPQNLPTYSVSVENSADCPRYIARKIEGVNISSAPPKISVRIERCGTRPISNIVDITNYVLYEVGQPLHAFDADKLQGGKIIVRRAKSGEKILALDGKTYNLDPEILVIADDSGPVAIAGIMGGEATAVTAGTKNILLESAVFDRKLVHRARKKLNLASESSYRFERGVTHWTAEMGSARAEKLIQEIAGGRTVAFNDVKAQVEVKTSTKILQQDMERLLGCSIDKSVVEKIFSGLGIPYQSSGEGWKVSFPAWRLDLEIKEDFIEEVARHWGYNHIPSGGQKADLSLPQHRTGNDLALARSLEVLRGFGFTEAVNYGMLPRQSALEWVGEKDWVEIENPLSSDQEVLRPSLLPELLKNLATNLAYSHKNLRFYEVGTVFSAQEGIVQEQKHLAGVAVGKLHPDFWAGGSQDSVDFYWLKSAVQSIGDALGQNFIWEYRAPKETQTLWQVWSKEWLHPVLSAILKNAEGKILGMAGVLHPKKAKKFTDAEGILVFALNYGQCEQQIQTDLKLLAPQRTPFIQRDISVTVDKTVSWQDVESEIARVEIKELESYRLFDVYEKPEQMQKSFAFTLTFRSGEKTLNDDAANKLRDQVFDRLKKTFHAVYSGQK